MVQTWFHNEPTWYTGESLTAIQLYAVFLKDLLFQSNSKIEKEKKDG